MQNVFFLHFFSLYCPRMSTKQHDCPSCNCNTQDDGGFANFSFQLTEEQKIYANKEKKLQELYQAHLSDLSFVEAHTVFIDDETIHLLVRPGVDVEAISAKIPKDLTSIVKIKVRDISTPFFDNSALFNLPEKKNKN